MSARTPCLREGIAPTTTVSIYVQEHELVSSVANRSAYSNVAPTFASPPRARAPVCACLPVWLQVPAANARMPGLKGDMEYRTPAPNSQPRQANVPVSGRPQGRGVGVSLPLLLAACMVFLGSGERAQHVQVVREGAGLGKRQILFWPYVRKGYPRRFQFFDVGFLRFVEPMSLIGVLYVPFCKVECRGS